MLTICCLLNPYQVHVLKIAMIDANAAVVFSRFVKSETCKRIGCSRCRETFVSDQLLPQNYVLPHDYVSI